MANNPTSSDEDIITGFELLFRVNYASVWRYVARRVDQVPPSGVTLSEAISTRVQFVMTRSPAPRRSWPFPNPRATP